MRCSNCQFEENCKLYAEIRHHHHYHHYHHTMWVIPMYILQTRPAPNYSCVIHRLTDFSGLEVHWEYT